MDLMYYTIEELEIELERRKREKNKPEIQPNINLGHLKRVCQKYIDSIGHVNSDSSADQRHEIFETAMVTFFGVDVWKYIQQQMS